MIIFRADSNPQIASGHVMRCISIAAYCRKQGQDVLFIIADEHPVRMLEQYSMPYRVLNSDWQNLSLELPLMIDILSQIQDPVLIVDTYSITKNYVDTLSPYARIWYLGSKPEYLGKLDGLINYSSNIDYEWYHSHYDKDRTKLLLGTQYAPLREEFQAIEKLVLQEVKNILVTTGNTDPNNTIGLLLENLLKEPELSQIRYHVVVGNSFTHKAELMSAFGACPQICFHEYPVKMSELMKEVDLAITTNGTTVYELIASKVPVISFAMVTEQIASAEGLASLGCIEYCGATDDDLLQVCTNVVSAVKKYLPYAMRRELVDKASTHIDGDGCKRIYEQLITL